MAACMLTCQSLKLLTSSMLLPYTDWSCKLHTYIHTSHGDFCLDLCVFLGFCLTIKPPLKLLTRGCDVRLLEYFHYVIIQVMKYYMYRYDILRLNKKIYMFVGYNLQIKLYCVSIIVTVYIKKFECVIFCGYWKLII